VDVLYVGSKMKTLMRKPNQRDKMRELFRKYPRDREIVIREYAKAEQDGVVSRLSNSRGIIPEDYAARLFADGIKKGWIHE
jgi:DNA transposition AAA+ family ATPase